MAQSKVNIDYDFDCCANNRARSVKAQCITDHTRSNGHMLLQNYIKAGDQDDNYTKLTDVIQVPDYNEKPVVHGD